MIPRRIGLRWVVAALVLATVLPLGLAAALGVRRAWRRQIATVERQNVETVRAISVAIDQEVETTTAALDFLGALHALDGPDLQAFDNLAQRLIVRRPDWSAIVLTDPRGRLLATTPARDLQDAAFRASEWAPAVVSANHFVVSPLFQMPGLPGHFVVIALPVVRDAKVTLVLGALVRADAFSAILRRQQTPPEGLVALVDSANNIVARSRQEDSYVGTPVTSAFLDIAARTNEAAWQTETREGVPVYSAFSRSPRTGLTVGLALPREQVDGPFARILWYLSAIWLGFMALAGGVALVLGQTIVRAMSSASKSAMKLARGETVVPRRSRVAEIDELATQLRDASDLLAARNRERDEASRIKDEFLMTVSHELRTPLTAIYGWARMLSTGEIRDAQRPRAAQAIERNASALQQLVNDLLDVSRIVSGRLRLDVQSVVAADVVSAAIDAVRPAAVAKQIRVTTAIPDAALRLSADPDRLRQVIWNLLANAVKFTPAGGQHRSACRRGSGRGRVDSARYRSGRRSRLPAARVRSIPPGRGRHDPRPWRSWAGPGDRAPPRGTARRHGVGHQQCTGSRCDVPCGVTGACLRRASERPDGFAGGRRDGRRLGARQSAGRPQRVRGRRSPAHARDGHDRAGERRRRCPRRGVRGGRADGSPDLASPR